MHGERESSVDEKIIIMSIIICRTLFYTFGIPVVKNINKNRNLVVRLDEKMKSNLKLLKDTTLSVNYFLFNYVFFSYESLAFV